MPEINAKEVLEEMRKSHEALKTHVDKQIEESRKNGDSSTFAKEAVEKINTELGELRTKYDDLVLAEKRSNLAKADGIGAVETPEQIEMRSAFSKFLRNGMGETGRSTMTAEEVRALSSASDSEGGFLVPTAFESGLLTLAFDDAEIRPLADVAPTGRDTVQLAAISKPVVAWGSRNIAIPEQMLSTGGERLEIFDLKALTLIHNNTLEDSESDVWNELLKQFAMAIAETEDDAFAVGAGNNSPQGILSDPRVLANSVNSGVAGGLVDGSNNGVDALITMLQSLKKTYRRNSTWAMNSTTEGEIRKLKDANGQYLWQPPVLAGAAPTLLGRPLVNPEAYPDVAANSQPISLGDFRKGYKIRDRSGISVQRLVERYAELDHTGFIVKKRVGGQVVIAEAFTTLKISA